MTAVIDANVIAALVFPVTYTPQASQLMVYLDNTDKDLIAPTLFEYEIATIFWRSVAFGLLDEGQVSTIWNKLFGSRIRTIAPTASLHRAALQLAGRLNQNKAYDAHYLALAAQENAPFWTADRRLAAGAQQAGLTWVYWVGDWQANDG